MKQLIEYCEELLKDDSVDLNAKSNGELARWIAAAKRQIDGSVVLVPLGDYIK